MCDNSETVLRGNPIDVALDEVVVDPDNKENVDSFGNPNDAVIHFFGGRVNKIVVVVHLSVFFYSTCFWIQDAVFTYISKQLGVDFVIFGSLQTTYSLIQLAGGPLFGLFGDVFGSRLAMIMSVIASAISYFLLYISTAIPILFLSRIPSIFMHGVLGSQMIVTDVYDSEERANGIVKLGITYTLGLVFGTTTGGLIAKFLYPEASAMVAFLGSLLNVILLYTTLPPVVKRKKVKENQSQNNVLCVWKFLELIKNPSVVFLLFIKLGTGIPICIFRSMFGIVALDVFKVPVDKYSIILPFVGVLAILVKVFAVDAARKRCSDLVILTVSAAQMVPSFFALTFATSMWQMCLVLTPLVTSVVFQTIIITSALANAVPNSDTGAMLGLNMAANSLIFTLSPTIGGHMLESFGFHSFGYFGFVSSSIVMMALILKLRRERH